jgi:predicted PhzF superfamily epimerase YddE/YHI9
LASAFVILNCLDNSSDAVRFDSKSGTLKVTRQDDLLAMDFPSRKAELCPTPKELVSGLGIEPKEVFRSRDYLAVFDSEDQIKSLQPDMYELSKLDSLGIIVSAAGSESDFVSRFFAPKVGIPEDPVTGSAHSTLIPYWAERLGKSELRAFQLSKRGGELFCKHRGDRVIIAGRAVIYLKGTITI